MSAWLRIWLGALALALVMGSNGMTVGVTATSVRQAPSDELSIRAALDQYCVTCHNTRLRTAGLALDTINVGRLSASAETWEKVIRKVRAGVMPPAGVRQPDRRVREGFVAALEAGLDREGAAAPRPGRPVAHRLNRTEYANAIRDLLDLEIDAPELLPADESGYGFDNIGDVLSMSPALLERYLVAARKISRLAVGDPTIRSVSQVYRLPYLTLMQDDRMSDDLPAGTRGGTVVRHDFPVDGEYRFRLYLQRNADVYGGNVRGLLEEENRIDLRVDGALVKTFTVGGPTRKYDYYSASGSTPRTEGARLASEADADLDIRLPVKAGVHHVGVAFVRNPSVVEGGGGPGRVPVTSGLAAEARGSGEAAGKMAMGLDSLQISGPFAAQVPEERASRRRIFQCDPMRATQEITCARSILSTLARRAYRRPVTARETEELLTLYSAARAKGGFDRGIQRALEGILTYPDFLIRVEQSPGPTQRGQVYRVSNVDLASRLSFFLWSSIPDEELLRLAEQGRLHESAVLMQQVQRMLQDDRAHALITNFFGQWLSLRPLATHTPDPEEFPRFDENLRRAFQRETELFLTAQVRGDRPAMELLTANYAFLNERLARHYGIPKIYGSHFRRVTYPDGRRAGLLGHGSILTVSSYTNRTSPVLRGKWLLTELLGMAPPPPPPDVPAFPEKKDGVNLPSVRARLEQHRKNPVCATCHAQMDPLGFALESFDAVGRWRIMDGNTPVDTSGSFAGVAFNGPQEFRERILLANRELFLSTLTYKLLTYALGRGAEVSDMPAVRQILRQAAPREYRWSSLVAGIVTSLPFQMAQESNRRP